MRFSASHFFADVEFLEFSQLFVDEPFNEALCRAVHIERTLKARQFDGNALEREVLVVPERTVPGPIKALLGGDRVGFTETMSFDVPRGEGKFTCEPTLLKDRVRVSGTLRLIATDGGVRRDVEGDVKVSVFGVGKVVERFIVADVEKSYEDAARFTTEYLKSKS